MRSPIVTLKEPKLRLHPITLHFADPKLESELTLPRCELQCFSLSHFNNGAHTQRCTASGR